MSWITFNINLTRCAEALERVAVVLERAFPLPEFVEVKRPNNPIVRVSPESLWLKQDEKERRRIREEEGLPPKENSEPKP